MFKSHAISEQRSTLRMVLPLVNNIQKVNPTATSAM
jgi:hypothetical protein